MQIRIATSEDLDDLVRIYAAARRYMAEHGNPHQWGDGRPSPEEIASGVEEGAYRVGVDEADRAHFAFTIYNENLTMQHIVAKAGFSYCGIIHLEDGDPRLAYQLVL